MFSRTVCRLSAGGLVALTLGLSAPAQNEDPVFSEEREVTDGRPVSFRAFWADAFSSGFKSSSQISTLVSRAVAGRYNAIIAEVLAYQDNVGSGHGAYWNSSIVPKATDISGGIDPLATLVTQAHNAGLEVHAWIVPFRVCTSWPPSGNTRVQARWISVLYSNMGGGPSRVSGSYNLDPGSPEVQEYLISIVRELVTNYAIDGINLDYIRYLDTNAGYPADPNYAGSSLARFQRLTGYVGTPPPSGETSWNDFRRRTINEFVRRCRAEIPSITSNPRQPVRFTADLVAWGYAPSNFANSDAYRLFCDWRTWMEKGWLDAGIPMNYKREHESDEAAMYRSWVTAALGWRYARHMFCGQGNYLNTMANSVTQMQFCLTSGADGVVNYSYWDTCDQNIDGTPESDPNWYTYVANQVYTVPATTPTMPWRYPATATEGTLWGRCADPVTGTPIDGATVRVGTLNPVETDGNGYYVVTLIPAGPGGTAYTVQASKSGCPTVTLTDVMVQRGTIVRQDISLCSSVLIPGDFNGDGRVNRTDLNYMLFCLSGPGQTYADGHMCIKGDANGDHDVDMEDFASFQRLFNLP